MKVEEFIEELNNVLDLDEDEITDESYMLQGTIASVDLLFIIALCDELFSKTLTSQELWSVTTVGKLLDLIGRDHFEK